MVVDQIFGIGFFMGLIGSAHCIGMCGPLVMSLPIFNKTPLEKTISMLLYHIGKIMSYVILGLIAGFFGKQLFVLNTQQQLSIIIGSIMIVYVVWVFLIHPKYSIKPFPFLEQPVLFGLARLFKSKKTVSFFVIGILNGLLPCGMVYLALGSAMASGTIANGALFMLFFGLGTIPALLMVALGGQYMGFVFRRKLQKMLPVFIFTMGVVLILRGMNLGIPFVSPQIEMGNISCHN